MSKCEFKVGEKVRCFDVNGTADGTVTKVESDCITVYHSGGKDKDLNISCWHPYQVRRLRKKPCPTQGERVEFWVPLSENPMKISPLNSGMIGISRAALITGWRMVELKPGETILSRDKLAKAWDVVSAKSHGVSTCFGHLAEALGLEGSAK